MEIELTGELAEGIYSNSVVIANSSSEFVFDFLRLMPGVDKARVKSRVVMTPENAKRLLLLLQDNLRRHEAKFGPIVLPNSDFEPYASFSKIPKGDA